MAKVLAWQLKFAWLNYSPLNCGKGKMMLPQRKQGGSQHLAILFKTLSCSPMQTKKHRRVPVFFCLHGLNFQPKLSELDSFFWLATLASNRDIPLINFLHKHQVCC